MKTICYCLFISYLGIWASCNKNFDCRGSIYSFETFYKASLYADSVRINDTIWIELNASTHFKDLTSNRTVDYSGAANFGTVISYLEFTGGDVQSPGVIPAANNFENILIKGSSVKPIDPEQLRDFLFKEENEMYKFKVGILPKKKGTFAIAPSNAGSVYQKNDKCTKADFSLTFKDTNQHLYLYEQNRPGYVPSEYEHTHMYCFKVY